MSESSIFVAVFNINCEGNMINSSDTVTSLALCSTGRDDVLFPPPDALRPDLEKINK